ncbi:Os11g0574950 [Oryza sativa Japonica Group]|uniref:Os11g0574950 protein n=1 Tax=Oryza sativa subsp. japonica TaxID=39947 RepID=A0A0P0Y3Q7_ORYSJ|nr:Os11g0574950 [Oryza sativa Japonica Group]
MTRRRRGIAWHGVALASPRRSAAASEEGDRAACRRAAQVQRVPHRPGWLPRSVAGRDARRTAHHVVRHRRRKRVQLVRRRGRARLQRQCRVRLRCVAAGHRVERRHDDHLRSTCGAKTQRHLHVLLDCKRSEIDREALTDRWSMAMGAVTSFWRSFISDSESSGAELLSCSCGFEPALSASSPACRG